MSESLETLQPLATYFDPKTLKELGVAGHQLTVTSSHQPTELKKTGLSALMAKTPFGKDVPVPMDIDVACGLYDKAGNLIEVVWYGNLRNATETVRHHGDTFIGMNKSYRPNSVNESLSIRFDELDEHVHRLVVFVHSATLAPLKKAVFGKIGLYDANNNVIHEIEFSTLQERVTGLCAWQIVRTFDDDFRITALVESVSGKNAGELAKKWSITTPT